MSSGSNYDLMNFDLSAGLQNPLDFINSFVKMKTTVNEAFKDGFIDYTTLYGMINNINKIAGETGDAIDFFGFRLDGSAEAIT
jgi:hypothetical protein